MNKALKIIIPIVIIVALIAVFLGVYKKNHAGASEGSKKYTITVTDDQGKETKYEEQSDAETLREAMDILAKKGDFSYEADDSEYGAYVHTINGVKADFDNDGAYWAIYVNGEYGQYGIDEQPVEDGDTFGLTYEW